MKKTIDLSFYPFEHLQEAIQQDLQQAGGKLPLDALCDPGYSYAPGDYYAISDVRLNSLQEGVARGSFSVEFAQTQASACSDEAVSDRITAVLGFELHQKQRELTLTFAAADRDAFED
ncbi:MAG: hypothetical protein E1N59_785 [Puniceicoccaceae bacterium 5H]|nr:MAG: hypothetical protein E1N59_785 [Puniceicoccaceae bacterium 5H]